MGIICVCSLNAQLINVNPYPNGEPWLDGPIPTITPEMQMHIDAIPEMTLSVISASRELPEAVDNSNEIFFRPIFPQFGQSCGAASSVGYDFTYEINRLRNLPADYFVKLTIDT